MSASSSLAVTKILQGVPLDSITKYQLRWRGERVAHIILTIRREYFVVSSDVLFPTIRMIIYSESLTGLSAMHYMGILFALQTPDVCRIAHVSFRLVTSNIDSHLHTQYWDAL